MKKKKMKGKKRGIEQDLNPAIEWGTIKNQITQVGCNGRRHLDTHAKRGKEAKHVGCNRQMIIKTEVVPQPYRQPWER